MERKWNVKGDAASTVIFWVGGMLAAFICVMWLSRTLHSDHITLQRIDNELSSLQQEINTACRMNTYWRNHYPDIEEGSLLIHNSQICIDSSPCNVIYYQSNGSEPHVVDGDIVVEYAEMCMNAQKCDSLYYSSTSSPTLQGDDILIPDAIICVNEHPPVIRCRLLVCSTNTTNFIDLDKITYINITVKNDAFNFATN